MIIFDSVSHGYGKRMILHRFSFTFPSTGLYVLRGDSGTGKSTFLALIRGQHPQHGQLYVANLKPSKLLFEDALTFRRQMLGQVLQSPQMLEDATVREMILLYMRLKNVTIFPFQWFEKILHDVPLTLPIRHLSRGQKQRLALALAQLGSPPIFLLDEPLDGLDHANKSLIVGWLDTLKKDHLILIASHHEEWHVVADGELTFPCPSSHEGKGLTYVTRVPRPSHIVSPFTLTFLWTYHRRKAKRQKKSWSLPWLTLTLSLLMVLVSMTQFLGRTFLKWADGMMGGHYQWMEPIHEAEPTLEAFTDARLTRMSAILDYGEIETHYDVSYFDDHFADTTGYFVKNGYKQWFSSFQLGSFNAIQPLQWAAPAPFRTMKLAEHELVLGLPSAYVGLFSSWFGVLPTLSHLNEYVHRHRPLLYFDLEKTEWGYRNQIAFEVRGVIASTHVDVFHSMTNYTHHVYETMLRFPSSWLGETRVTPWEMKKTLRLRTQDASRWINAYVDHPDFHQLEMERLDTYHFLLFSSSRPFSFQQPPLEDLSNQTHVHSSRGYQFLPNQWLHGFALQTLWGTNEDALVRIAEYYAQHTFVEWISQQPPPGIVQGNVFSQGESNVKWVVQEMEDDVFSIRMSSTLANVLHVFKNQSLRVIIIDEETLHHVSLTISDIYDADTLTVYQGMYWWEKLLLHLYGIPSYELQPRAYAYYGAKSLTLPGWTITRPLETLTRTINDLQHLFYWAIFIVIVGLCLPLSLVIYLRLYREFHKMIPTFATFLQSGFRHKDMVNYQTMDFFLLILDMLWQVLVLFLPVDFFMQYELHQALFRPFTWTFPVGPFLGFLIFLFLMHVLYTLAVYQQLHQQFKQVS